MKARSLSIAAAVAAFCLPGTAQAVVYGGVDFPQGAISFADEIISYDPSFGGGNVPGAIYQQSEAALGAPDYPGNTNCTAAFCSYVSLGAGGQIIVKFTDNLLTGSGNDDDDLWIFEIGPDVEDTTVDISADGSNWFSVGLVTGSTRGVDIDAFGYGIGSTFSYVRLTDVKNEGQTSGTTVGADIDAVGAISTVAAAVPEPTTWALMIGGLGLVGGAMRRRATPALA